jgi:hypothetical protein
MADDQPPRTARERRWARLRKWGPIAVAAVALLALSQALWLWQSWPVRQLLPPSSAGSTL